MMIQSTTDRTGIAVGSSLAKKRLRARRGRMIAMVAFAATLLSVSVAQATPVRVDIRGVPGAGWTPWGAISHSDGSALSIAETFATSSATDGNVDVQITTSGFTFGRDYGVANVDQTIPFSAATPAELWSNQYFYNNAAGAPLTVTLDDLKAGSYEFTLYGYLNGIGQASIATTDIFVDGVDSGIDATNYGKAVTSPTPNYTAQFIEANAAPTVAFTVANDNDTVTIGYLNPTNGHFGLSGFELINVPEPSGISLIFLGIVGLSLGRRRSARK